MAAHGRIVTGVAALLHVAIILGGPDWYRFFGAGERMARQAALGSPYPTIITAGIAAVLAVWSLYGLSGADVIRQLPMLRLALVLIAAVYLLRGVLGIPVVLLVDDPSTHAVADQDNLYGRDLGDLYRAGSLLRHRCRRIRSRTSKSESITVGG